MEYKAREKAARDSSQSMYEAELRKFYQFPYERETLINTGFSAILSAFRAHQTFKDFLILPMLQYNYNQKGAIKCTCGF